MTIIDGLLQLDPNPTSITVSTVSTNVIDLLNARDMGVGDATGATPKVLAQIVTTFTGGTSIQALFQGAPNASGAPGAYTTYASGPVVALADAVVGNRLLEMDWPRPNPNAPMPRFVRLSYVVVGTMTAGQVTANIVLTDQAAPRGAGFGGGYPAGVTVAN